MYKDLVTYDIATKLRDNGFNEGCEYTFYNNYRVKDEIYDKHPGLSDDGYEDLRKRYGGPYEDDEVYGYYIEPLKLYSRNSTIGINPMTKTKVATNALCSCPHIHQVLEWLRVQKDIDIVIYPVNTSTGEKKYVIAVYTRGERARELQRNNRDEYVKWDDAALTGISYVLDNLI